MTRDSIHLSELQKDILKKTFSKEGKPQVIEVKMVDKLKALDIGCRTGAVVLFGRPSPQKKIPSITTKTNKKQIKNK
jgi:hypothetical protein